MRGQIYDYDLHVTHCNAFLILALYKAAYLVIYKSIDHQVLKS